MSNQEHQVDRIYVGLDELLDTRIGTLSRRDPKSIEAVLDANYFDREQDVFPGITREEFAELYKQRDAETLAASLMTNVYLLLSSFVKSSTAEDAVGGGPSKLIITINTYPYKFDEVEKNELLGVLTYHLGTDAVMEVVSVPMEFLTPAHVTANYVVMVMYGFPDWARMHQEAIRTMRAPNLVVYAPRLYGEMPTEEQLQVLRDANLEPFQAAEMASAPAFTLRLLSVDVFSMRDPVRDRKMANRAAAMAADKK